MQPRGIKVPSHKVIKSTQLHARRKRVLRNSSVLCATLCVPVGFCISYQDHSIWSESVLEIDPLHKHEWDPPQPTSSATEVLKTLLPTTFALIQTVVVSKLIRRNSTSAERNKIGHLLKRLRADDKSQLLKRTTALLRGAESSGSLTCLHPSFS